MGVYRPPYQSCKLQIPSFLEAKSPIWGFYYSKINLYRAADGKKTKKPLLLTARILTIFAYKRKEFKANTPILLAAFC